MESSWTEASHSWRNITHKCLSQRRSFTQRLEQTKSPSNIKIERLVEEPTRDLIFCVSKLQRNSAPCLLCAFHWMWKTHWGVISELCRKHRTALRLCGIAVPYCCCSWQTRNPVSLLLTEDTNTDAFSCAFNSLHQTWHSSSWQVGWLLALWSGPIQTTIHVTPAGRISPLQMPSLAFLSNLTPSQLLLLPILIPFVRIHSIH